MPNMNTSDSRLGSLPPAIPILILLAIMPAIAQHVPPPMSVHPRPTLTRS